MKKKLTQPPAIQHPRRGKSLLEMMAVIAIMAMLFPILAKLMWTVMQQGQSGETAFVTSTTLSRLSYQFRQDAHAANSAQFPPQQPGKLTLNLPDNQSVLYVFKKGELIRTQQQGDKITAHEVYRLPHRECQFQPQQAGKLVTLTIQSKNDLHARTPVAALNSVWSLKATVGRNYRFSASKKENE